MILILALFMKVLPPKFVGAGLPQATSSIFKPTLRILGLSESVTHVGTFEALAGRNQESALCRKTSGTAS